MENENATPKSLRGRRLGLSKSSPRPFISPCLSSGGTPTTKRLGISRKRVHSLSSNDATPISSTMPGARLFCTANEFSEETLPRLEPSQKSPKSNDAPLSSLVETAGKGIEESPCSRLSTCKKSLPKSIPRFNVHKSLEGTETACYEETLPKKPKTEASQKSELFKRVSSSVPRVPKKDISVDNQVPSTPSQTNSSTESQSDREKFLVSLEKRLASLSKNSDELVQERDTWRRGCKEALLELQNLLAKTMEPRPSCKEIAKQLGIWSVVKAQLAEDSEVMDHDEDLSDENESQY